MKIRDIVKENKKHLSFEVFPPKFEKNYESVLAKVKEISALKPDFMSVTYGAGGGTSEFTLKIAKAMKEDVPSMAHLTCVSSSKATVKMRIDELEANAIENIMALRGDYAEGQNIADSASWDYHHATDLIEELRMRKFDFSIGGACYPEMHPEAKSLEEDILFLKKKVELGCDFLTTQMFFDNEKMLEFRDKLASYGINVPLVLGIMPITNINQVDRCLNLSGCSVPKEMFEMIDKFGGNEGDMLKAGIDYAAKQSNALYDAGFNNIHVYTMNKPNVAKELFKALR